MKSAALVFLLAACTAGGGDGDDSYPVTPPGGGGTIGGEGGGGGGGDGGVGDGGDAPIVGRVCILGADMRNLAPATCVTPAGGLSVRLGSSMATTDATGAFTIVPTATVSTWTVSGTIAGSGPIVPVVMPFNSKTNQIPAMREDDYNALLGQHNIVLAEDEGSIVAHLVDASDASVATAQAAVVGGESQQTYYDGANLNAWLTISTGAAGMAWMPDNKAGGRMVTTTSGTITKTFP